MTHAKLRTDGRGALTAGKLSGNNSHIHGEVRSLCERQTMAFEFPLAGHRAVGARLDSA